MTTLEDVGSVSFRGRAPLVIAATIPLAILVTLPWRSQVVTTIPGFSGLWLSTLIFSDLLTAWLLLAQFRAGGSSRLAAVSWAYVWSAAMAVTFLFAVPGIISTTPDNFGDPNTGQWLWVSRHVVPPLLIGLALGPWHTREERGRRVPGRDLMVLLSVLVTAALAGGVVAFTVWLPDRLPVIIDRTTGRLVPWMTAVVVVVGVGSVVASAVGVWRRGSRHSIESWAVVASVTFLGDVLLTLMYEDRFTVAYYLARLLGLGASVFVLVAILHDIGRLQSAATDAARRLEERNAELVEATKLRDHLTAVVSHDMRTPLAGLQGYLEMLRDDDLESALARRMLERSWMLTRRLTLLTEDLLAAATLEHGDLVVSPELLDLDQQLGECATCFPDLDLELDCPPGLAAYADPLRLQQILANLVRNAQKHGAEPVLIAAAPDHATPGAVTIRVSDAGPGVPATFVPRLFDRYSQGTTTAPGGSGLGLSVVRDLVSAHHGTISYDGAGNAFVFTLPPPSARDAATDADRSPSVWSGTAAHL